MNLYEKQIKLLGTHCASKLGSSATWVAIIVHLAARIWAQKQLSSHFSIAIVMGGCQSWPAEKQQDQKTNLSEHCDTIYLEFQVLMAQDFQLLIASLLLFAIPLTLPQPTKDAIHRKTLERTVVAANQIPNVVTILIIFLLHPVIKVLFRQCSSGFPKLFLSAWPTDDWPQYCTKSSCRLSTMVHSGKCSLKSGKAGGVLGKALP